ncbi:MAG: O-linked N-acetylglucosamine transferase, SPINDLY family protein [Planktothrix agardhii]|uniref:O-linked N-acetylglucosamine transferase, SPINDLY family protein n=1 Tax=Planktothrix agardhii TaxID=1160 RepID=UPI003C3C4489
MITDNSLEIVLDWQQKANQFFIDGSYEKAADLYQQVIEFEPGVKLNYWYLGLSLLLQGQEVEAQTTWLLAMADGQSEEVEQWTEELIQVLQTEAQKKKEKEEYELAWLIRQHSREIYPADINNLLDLVGLSTVLKTYTGDQLIEWGVIDLLKNEQAAVDFELLLEVLTSIIFMAPDDPVSFTLVETALTIAKDVIPLLKILMTFVNQLSYCSRKFTLAIKFTELGLHYSNNHPSLLYSLSEFYQDNWQFDQGIETAKLCYSAMESIPGKVHASFMMMKALMSAGGNWDEFCSVIENTKQLLYSLMSKNKNIQIDDVDDIPWNCTFFFPYYQDNLKENLEIRRQVSQFCQKQFHQLVRERIEKNQQKKSLLATQNQLTKRLKIGYISHCFRSHSVGWLARWLINYHDREKFELYGYLVCAEPNPGAVQQWYISKFDKVHQLGISGSEVAEKIYEDEIDILIDLDSLTLTTTCEAMATKPAPIQVTWLGWDASGISTIDYFIADPYVLPEDAQQYYEEKIWRLPQTYLAIDGFELATPTLRRDELNIPNDAVIYFSGQRGFKYNPNTAMLQMKILKQVPNSYFLVKGLADQKSLKNFFFEIAESEGIASERLIFLPLAGSEAEHRTNLTIADIVLDTYPYNGATTTMETLWMGIPMVTRVGQQFSARNSYTMMINAGITEGIAWTDEEYVEWGIKLGTDENLRQQIAWKLRKNRQMAPLWNGKQFTREMENAYEQMWQKYIEGKN